MFIRDGESFCSHFVTLAVIKTKMKAVDVYNNYNVRLNETKGAFGVFVN